MQVATASNNFGVELAYTDFERIYRAGGSAYAEGLSTSLVSKLTLSLAFNPLRKFGTTYGRTTVSSNSASGITPGKDAKWGLSDGVGAEYGFSTNWSAMLQHDEYRMKFAGTGRDKINNTSLGIRYNF